jgi:hypothetical protein
VESGSQSSAPIKVSLIPDGPPTSDIAIDLKLTPAGGSQTPTTTNNSIPGVYLPSGQLNFALSGTGGADDDIAILLYREGEADPVVHVAGAGKDAWTANVTVPKDGPYRFTARKARGDAPPGKASNPVDVVVRTQGPKVEDVIPPDFGTAPGVNILRINFSSDDPLNATEAGKSSNYLLRRIGTAGVPDLHASAVLYPTANGALSTDNSDVVFDPIQNTATLTFPTLTPDIYQLEITGRNIHDIFGNLLEQEPGKKGADYIRPLTKPATAPAATDATVNSGMPGGPAPFVPYHEFTQPREVPTGFNPSDKVETRVVRLYYYRDAYRVAQIINRDARSYNRVAVEERRRIAEQLRGQADQDTGDRQSQERTAVRAAQQSRQVEKEYAQAQDQLAAAQKDDAAWQHEHDLMTQFKADPTRLTEFTQDPKKADTLKAQVDGRLAAADLQLTQTGKTLDAAKQRVQTISETMQAVRKDEVAATEKMQAAQAKEDVDRANQFRAEVAAAHEDPDTYAPGKPDSYDPVQQVSVSVIGDAMIQLRGPMKGVNIIRRMINEIDQPAGQVRVAIHTVQINGEHGDRMEKVASRIQDYIDHSRFLTQQSALMLRNAVVLVASRKAEQSAQECPGDDQEARDHRYLYAFFGKDFTDELKAMDSEFLKSGNKLLALHSMDTTSLASALFVLALAKNSTRMEILQEFQRMLDEQLPVAEQSYFEAGGDRKTGKCEKFTLLSQNARFQSFLGFFNADVVGDDTLNPPQREFIRLAQIFKSRLVTEMEFNQRVMERAMIEQRQAGTEKEVLEKQQAKEDAANKKLADLQQQRGTQRGAAFTALSQISGEIDSVLAEEEAKAKEVNDTTDEIVDSTQRLYDQATKLISNPNEMAPKTVSRKSLGEQKDINDKVNKTKNRNNPDTQEIKDLQTRLSSIKLNVSGRNVVFKLKDNKWDFEDAASRAAWQAIVQDAQAVANRYEHRFVLTKTYHDLLTDAQTRLKDILDWSGSTDKDPIDELANAYKVFQTLNQHVASHADEIKRQTNQLIAVMSVSTSDLNDAYRRWSIIRDLITTQIGGDLKTVALPLLNGVEGSFRDILNTELQVRLATEEVERSRRPIDQKKLLDMLIDEVEEKYIELLEGTRAHTANIDDYIKRVATALDDDFNTQFYLPTFREVREASRFWDVQFGDIETTSVLTNNRMFAKVEPQATMEFDLPHRDLLITEAMKDAKGMIDQYGALANDPTFLSLVKLRAGQPTSSLPQGASGAFPLERNVLPGLPRLSDEKLVSQRAQENRQLAAPLEALIPDPAIYKFETGTGYEISPVIQPDGQSVVFHFNYMYTTNIREPVRADEKHLGRVKRHFIDTEVQLGNYELREISRYQVALKASRTSRGVPGLEDIPGIGILFRPLPSAESSLQENIVLGQSTIFPTLFDLMGLRWAPAVADLEPLALENADFIVRARRRDLMNRVFDFSSSKVDEFLRIPPDERRPDLYRTQETIPSIHPNGYQGPGLNLRDSHLQEGYDPQSAYPPSQYIPRTNPDGARGVIRSPFGLSVYAPGDMVLPPYDPNPPGGRMTPGVPPEIIQKPPHPGPASPPTDGAPVPPAAGVRGPIGTPPVQAPPQYIVPAPMYPARPAGQTPAGPNLPPYVPGK